MVPSLFKHLATSFRMPWLVLMTASTQSSCCRNLSALSAAASSRLLASPAGGSPSQPASSRSSAQCGATLLGRCQQLLCFQPSAGMKTKSALKRRCKDCFIVRRRGRLFVFCKTNPRHKQRQG
ncbi:hypothetical protein NHX12_023641 [Muraenolepis orangiensis]|uniref:Ribosomal protein n=1 Tax=Muraenolepis orangiensis TaxID=630683 RepID=A0A9Q0ISX4_9TELE|nr:hypothetical protein NHX12_023641 [Muraenolepis orangiensis]